MIQPLTYHEPFVVAIPAGAGRSRKLAFIARYLAGDATPQRPQRRRQRKPTLAGALKQAARAGQPVKAATLRSDGVTLEFVEPDEQGNELDEWIAKHARQTERH